MTPSDLLGHRIVGGPASTQAMSWQFDRAGEKVAITLRAHISDNTNAGAVACAVGGLGITSTTAWACDQELKDGSLVRLLADWKTADLPVNAYFPMGCSTRLAARAFVDFLALELRSQ